jgi:hypothetical protein
MTKDIIREEARLIVLRALHEQTNYASSDSVLQQVLETYGIAKTREWVREEISYLDRIGAVSKQTHGSVVIAQLLDKGVEHVERRLVLEGVKRPSPLTE